MKRTAPKIIILISAISLIVVTVIAGLSVLLVYGHDEAARAGNEAATVQNLKAIAAVETQYYSTHSRTFGTFEQLVGEQMLSRKFAANPVNVDGYVLTLILVPGAPNIRSSYTVRADPLNRKEGRKHFYLDSESRQIHVNPEKPAGSNDPIVSK
jgi:Tfp pilus assembly protein PilE